MVLELKLFDVSELRTRAGQGKAGDWWQSLVAGIGLATNATARTTWK